MKMIVVNNIQECKLDFGFTNEMASFLEPGTLRPCCVLPCARRARISLGGRGLLKRILFRQSFKQPFGCLIERQIAKGGKCAIIVLAMTLTTYTRGIPHQWNLIAKCENRTVTLQHGHLWQGQYRWRRWSSQRSWSTSTSRISKSSRPPSRRWTLTKWVVVMVVVVVLKPKEN